jgi:hypothetical protein
MPHNQRQRFNEAFGATGLTVDELWLRYFSLGGDAGQLEIDAYLNGAIACHPYSTTFSLMRSMNDLMRSPRCARRTARISNTHSAGADGADAVGASVQ